MNDIVTAATKVAKRLTDNTEDPSTVELAETVMEATEDEHSNTSEVKQYAKKAALVGAVALARRVLAENERMNANQGIDEDATRVKVVDPDERATESDTTKSESEESSGGLFSLKRVLFLGALVGVGYAAVKKLRSKGDQHTLEEWGEPAATETGTVGESDAGEADVDIGAGVADEGESEDVNDHDVDIGAGEADENESSNESNTTTDPTEVADGEPVDVDEDESVETEDDSVGADPSEVAVEEDDEDEDERLSQSE